ncbi:multiple epidermal growth factor-like domains protein 10 [Asterias rubens]|uniref:multiple epidermal growth factor-like domains protein 10 n=1 Tax=Asterias rubens TaxID=7604 RepID=UPI001455B4BD|nr:multiple epidermal growth factor-like domains protein 10 [Asterias rubens]
MAVLNPTLRVLLLCICFTLGEASEHWRLRFQRAVCGGPLVKPGNICRWTSLECSCVAGTYCSLYTHTCTVCEVTTDECISPCRYPCQNGGSCELETASCSCQTGFVGEDCSSVETAPAITESPYPPVQPSTCERECLNGGVCMSGTCDCPSGYYYPDCSLCLPRQHPTKCIEHCRVECQNSGDCLTTHQRCHCTEDFTGEDCTLCIPSKARRNCTDICPVLCANGATCNVKTRKCECTSGWTGGACQEPCPPGRFGQNCLGLCECLLGPCDPLTGRCLCDPNAPIGPDCSAPCDCLVDGVCRTQANCPSVGSTPVSPTPPVLGPTTLGHQGTGGLIGDSLAKQEKFPMMVAIVATAAGAIVLLVIVIILVAFLVKSRRHDTRKLERTEEAEQIPMTTGVADNAYEDASSSPMNSLQITQSPFRPTSGYEDVTDLHKNMPDLLPEADEISPYATTGNITIHANAAPSEYAYVGGKDLKAFQQGGESHPGEFYDKLNFSPRDKSSCKQAEDGMYGALKDDGTYDDTSSSQTSVPLYDDPDCSGYAKMSPSLNNRKASSLKHPKNDLQFDVLHKTTSLKSPRTGAAAGSSGTFGRKQPYENTYVDFDPESTPSDVEGGTSQVANPPQPVTQKYVSPPADPKSQREIPQYAKPMKRKSQLEQQEAPQYAKPMKRKSETNSTSPSIPQYAKPNKKSSKGGPNGFSDQSKSPQMKNEGGAQGSRPGAGYAHLMHATTPSKQ